MKKPVFLFTLSITSLFLTGAGWDHAIAAKHEAPDNHNAAHSLDWEGAYTGTIPSASGTGYETVLVLGSKRTYILSQRITHKGKRQLLQSTGRFDWKNDGSVVQLGTRDDRQQWFVSEGYVEMYPPAEDSQAYRLNKMLAYPGGRRETLLIDPASIRQSQPKAAWVSFAGIWNMNHAAQGGHRSLQAQFRVNCQALTYRMPEIAYYRQTWLRGKLIHSATENNNDIVIPDSDKVMRSVLADHCPEN